MDSQHMQESDEIMSMISSISELKQSRQQMKEKITELNNMIEELIGPDMLEKVCPQGHPLRYIVHQQSLMGHSYCDKCGVRCDKVSSVRWRCKRCDYDQCTRCGGFRKNLCPFMHRLKKKVLPQNEKTLSICDICLKPVIGTHYSCECDYDICGKCKQ